MMIASLLKISKLPGIMEDRALPVGAVQHRPAFPSSSIGLVQVLLRFQRDGGIENRESRAVNVSRAGNCMQSSPRPSSTLICIPKILITPRLPSSPIPTRRHSESWVPSQCDTAPILPVGYLSHHQMSRAVCPGSLVEWLQLSPAVQSKGRFDTAPFSTPKEQTAWPVQDWQSTARLTSPPLLQPSCFIHCGCRSPQRLPFLLHT
ncbi:hypothetical protein B0T19DRAFT_112571 [Cercophora scortea]|uniref:Uncharacterized protein n=1 Tax=Cercophora scortea TaxID=314031 RepID=A0AAE0MIG1_9PEZI|nr:hypothetical protein B0T19DRAFT_112571 [Cercophora scortea]